MTRRFLICAPSSGSGKTTVVCAILRALLRRGLKPVACKSGPDYIDPMFHSSVLGAKSCNLDLFFFSRETARALLAQNARGADVTILEGAMGYYDGIAMGADASAYELACATHTPAVLVVNAKGAALSIAAMVKGFLDFRRPSCIAGVIFNRVSPMLYPRLAKTVTDETGLPVFGYLPEMPDCAIESRHLGLVTAAEIEDLQQKLDKLSAQAEKTLALDALLALAGRASAISDELPALTPVDRRVRIAVARDRAFCFYYEDSLDVLRRLGAELVEFSPLSDRALPENIQGLYLGGGYPELYAKALAGNEPMRRAVREAVAAGLPTIAECGGFLYLHKTLTDAAGETFPMAGALDAAAYPTGRLTRFGYVTLTATVDTMLLARGESIPAHEFHYWDSTAPGESYTAQKPQSDRRWLAGVATNSLYAGFAHFHFAARPDSARRFLKQAIAFANAERRSL